MRKSFMVSNLSGTHKTAQVLSNLGLILILKPNRLKTY